MKRKIFAGFIAIIILIQTGCNYKVEPLADRVDKYIENSYKDGGFNGTILIADNGAIVYEKSYGYSDFENKMPNSSETIFKIGSITKQFTAMAIMMLQEYGKLKLEDKLNKYIPDFPGGNTITIHNLLSMSSGITNDVKGVLPIYDRTKGTYIDLNSETLKDKTFTVEELISLFKNKNINFKAGERFEYSNSNYILLAYIIEKVSGMSYKEFLNNKIFIPLGMVNTGFVEDELNANVAVGYDKVTSPQIKTFSYSMSIFYGFGDVCSTVEDLYKWDRSLYTETLVKNSTIKKMFEPFTSIKDYPNHSYGYGWIVNDLTTSPISEHDGALPGFSSYIFRATSTKRTIIILTNNTSFISKIYNFKEDLVQILNVK